VFVPLWFIAAAFDRRSAWRAGALAARRHTFLLLAFVLPTALAPRLRDELAA
jgi:hypothetical protein